MRTDTKDPIIARTMEIDAMKELGRKTPEVLAETKPGGRSEIVESQPSELVTSSATTAAT
jgi:hypothetical protein